MYIGKNNTSTNKYNKVFSFQSICIRFQLSLFFWPNYVPTFVVKFKHTFTTCLHDRIISLGGGGVCVHKTCLTPATFFIEVPVLSQERKWVCTCVSGVSILSLSTTLIFDFGNVLSVWYFYVFIYSLYIGTIGVIIHYLERMTQILRDVLPCVTFIISK